MTKFENLPKEIPIFPLSNFIIFPEINVPLNIFEPRYVQMIDDSMKSNRFIGMIQPKKTGMLNKPDLYDVGCVGKITKEISTEKLYRICKINYENFADDLTKKKEGINFSDLELIFKNLKSLFKKKGYMINWKDFEKQSLDQAINTLAMASPFSLEEKQILLETIDVNNRKIQLEKILNTYIVDDFNNTTIQ